MRYLAGVSFSEGQKREGRDVPSMHLRVNGFLG